MSALVYIGDVHLDRDDDALDDFVRFLQGLPDVTSRIVLMGDLFNLWLAHPATEESQHRKVVETLVELRRRGVWVGYLEGNRDYRVAHLHDGIAFDRCGEEGWTETVAGRQIYAVHGHGLNPDDVSYRRWHRLSRSGLVWWIFHRIPGRARVRYSLNMERRLRKSNRQFKKNFPEELLRNYAEQRFATGADDVVLGHFHVEKQIDVAGQGTLWVLPEWKGSRRHLEVSQRGEIRFVDSRY